MSLPALIVYEAVGYATTTETFNDVQEIGLWPSHLYIQKVAAITLYTGNTIVNGIEITYDMTNDSPKTIVHGKKEGNAHSHVLTADEFFVGFFGAMDDNPDAPILRRIGFVVYNKATGAITTFGPFPSPSNPPHKVKGFSSLGLIAGFSGTQANNGKLDTLAVYKFLSADKKVGLSAGL